MPEDPGDSDPASQGHISEEELRHFRQVLRRSGLRATRPRMLLLRFLIAQKGPLSHSRVAAHLAVFQIDKATAYRTLVALEEVQILRRFDLGDRIWMYELIQTEERDGPGHPHFVCIRCGMTQCMTSSPAITAADMHRLGIGDVSEILIRGICSTCKAARD